VLSFDQVLGFADAMLFLCAFVNLLGVYLLLPVVKKEMTEYLADRKSGALSREAAEPPPVRFGTGA
jgi:AGCS family alanine or glycine:cation symporter